MFRAGLDAADPDRLVRDQRGYLAARMREWGTDRVRIVAAGKAAWRMGEAAEAVFGRAIDHGIGIVPRGTGVPARSEAMDWFEAGHPLPDAAGIRATEAAIALLESAGRGTMVLFLISGGASSLFVAPRAGTTLEEKRRRIEALLKGGAEIGAIHRVRSALSRVKGGEAARIARPAPVCGLILSDVPGDDPEVVGGGPSALP
ncbi:MAG: DUF4147 domain-containing protein, partial [Candidatus Latescibacteria bacterium]|nr:DUF4147 domain-containing protein [Candidatus Latescibacterota bacterium]